MLPVSCELFLRGIQPYRQKMNRLFSSFKALFAALLLLIGTALLAQDHGHADEHDAHAEHLITMRTLTAMNTAMRMSTSTPRATT